MKIARSHRTSPASTLHENCEKIFNIRGEDVKLGDDGNNTCGNYLDVKMSMYWRQRKSLKNDYVSD